MEPQTPYIPKNKVRIVTAASLFDGHDAAINIMRRIMQGKGAEIIHLGHNRSVREIVECAIEEDAQGIAITSYQGGHVEFFKYMKDLLEEIYMFRLDDSHPHDDAIDALAHCFNPEMARPNTGKQGIPLPEYAQGNQGWYRVGRDTGDSAVQELLRRVA